MSQTPTLRQKDKKQSSRPPEKSEPPLPSLPTLAKLLPSEGNVTVPVMLFHHWEAQHKKEMATLDKLGLAMTSMGRAALRRIQALELRVAVLEQQRKGGAPRAARQRKKK
jgi:hypothetical protein